MWIGTLKIKKKNKGGRVYKIFIPYRRYKKVLKHFEWYAYEEEIELYEDEKAILKDDRHLLGIAIYEIFLNENNEEVKIVYSGHLGNVIISIIKNLTIFTKDDYVILETTYSDIFHNESLIKIIQSIIKNQWHKSIYVRSRLLL